MARGEEQTLGNNKYNFFTYYCCPILWLIDTKVAKYYRLIQIDRKVVFYESVRKNARDRFEKKDFVQKIVTFKEQQILST